MTPEGIYNAVHGVATGRFALWLVEHRAVVLDVIAEELATIPAPYWEAKYRPVWATDQQGWPRVQWASAAARHRLSKVDHERAMAALHQAKPDMDTAWATALRLPRRPTMAEVEGTAKRFLRETRPRADWLEYAIGVYPSPKWRWYVAEERGGDFHWEESVGAALRSMPVGAWKVFEDATAGGTKPYEIVLLYLTDAVGSAFDYSVLASAAFDPPVELVGKKRLVSREPKEALIAALQEKGWSYAPGRVYEYLTHPDDHVRLQLKARNARMQWRAAPSWGWHATGLSWGSIRELAEDLDNTLTRAAGFAAKRPTKQPKMARAAPPVAEPHAAPTAGTVILHHSAAEGTVLRGDTRPVKDTIKALGFRWYKGGQFWYIPRSRGMVTSPVDVPKVKSALEGAGATAVFELPAVPAAPAPSASPPPAAEKIQAVLDALLAKWPGHPAIELAAGDPGDFPAERDFAYLEGTVPPFLLVYAPKLAREPMNVVLGLLAHELGHASLLVQGRAEHTEREADAEASALFGVMVRYDDRTVQTIGRGVSPRPAHLPESSERAGPKARAPEPPRGDPAKLRVAADALEEKIQGKLHPATSEQAPTRRRAGIIASMLQEAEWLQKIQGALRAMADATEAGTLDPLLRNVTTKVAVEELLRWSKPTADVHVSALKDLLDDTEGIRGVGQAHKRMLAIWRAVASSENYRVFLDAQRAEDIQALLAACRKEPGHRCAKWTMLPDEIVGYRRAVHMGLGKAEDWTKAHAAIKALAEQGTRRPSPEEQAAKKVKELERGLIGTTIPGFFPTPPSVVQQMLAYASVQPGQRVLEPSAGHGAIADAIRGAAPAAQLDVVEYNYTLREILAAKGHKLVAQDFLEYNPGPVYDKILMNPPFEQGQDIEHVQHAWDLLAPGGRVVAIMSEGPFFRQDRQSTGFREWLDHNCTDAVVEECSMKLPEGSFLKSPIRTTGVAARIVVLEKPNSEARSHALA